ncbi:MAG TPA: hypothetical protein PK812_08785, partial [Beijerinckiaceae bacterium]|nr:hypothetical protein [Beijerinckiaceae bacterium]
LWSSKFRQATRLLHLLQRPAQGLPPGVLALQAIYSGTNRPVSTPVIWRIYVVHGNEPTLTATSAELAPTLPLPPGEYMVHLSQGLAAVTRRIVMTAAPLSERLTLNAGGLVLRAKLAEAPVPASRQAISVFIPAPNDSEGKLVTNSLKAGELLRLPEGTYHVVSTYAGSNSVVRADIQVQSGRVTEATMNHKAATMTLKLVRQVGGVAVANTSWTVQTPGGDLIREALGAFPTMELAEGEYEVIARNDGREFKERMKVVSGINRDHEVVMR